MKKVLFSFVGLVLIQAGQEAHAQSALSPRVCAFAERKTPATGLCPMLDRQEMLIEEWNKAYSLNRMAPVGVAAMLGGFALEGAVLSYVLIKKPREAVANNRNIPLAPIIGVAAGGITLSVFGGIWVLYADHRVEKAKADTRGFLKNRLGIN